MRPDEVVLVHLPLFHIYGLEVLMNGCISVGATQVMMGRFDMEPFLKLLADHKVTMLFTVPPVGLGLTQYPGVGNYDLSSLRLGFFGAAPLSADMQDRIQEVMGFPIIQGYGMTETSPVTNADFVESELRKAGSIGPAVSDTEEKVVDLEDDTKEVGVDEAGELMVRGPQVMKGYYNNAQATADTLTEDGWLHTGDIVRMDSDRYVFVLDRKKELIKYKGFQVPPAELEGILLEHPGIADAAVIGKLDEESGEIPKAFVVRSAGSEVSDDEVMSFVADKVATFKRIREVEFIDAIPKNASGKILRRILIEKERGETVV
jgi:acyl-CoA synthetase (AMP-forming)/AMP-acid ligase II